jgi:hypothetical protein
MFLMLVCCGVGFALEPDEILVIANKDIVGWALAHQFPFSFELISIET